jgi:hypothetical protein
MAADFADRSVRSADSWVGRSRARRSCRYGIAASPELRYGTAVNAILPFARAATALAAAYAVVLSVLLAGLGPMGAAAQDGIGCRTLALDFPAKPDNPANERVPHDCCFGCPAAAADLPSGTAFVFRPLFSALAVPLQARPRPAGPTRRIAHAPRAPPG